MRNFWNILLVIFCLPLAGFSQSTTAEQLMNKVKAHYDSDYAFQADFTIEVDVPEAEKTVMDGTIFIKDSQFKFQTNELTVISDNINMWYWTKTNTIDEVQISHVEDAEDIIQPSDVFNMYLKGFDHKLVSETTFNGKNLALIELIPEKRDDSSPYFKIKAVVNKDNSSIDKLDVFYKDGTVYTFKIKNEKATSFNSNFFRFNESANPSTEVIDLR